MASERQQLILSACKTGNIAQLRQLFTSLGIKPGAPEKSTTAASTILVDGPITTSTLIYTAIEHHQPTILSFLLTTYPSVSFDNVGNDHLAASLQRHPHLPTFKVIYKRNPNILHGDEGAYGRSILGQACSTNHPAIPNFLLDEGAHPEFPAGSFALALSCALHHGQPLSLIKRLVACGAKYRTHDITIAIRHLRFDVAEWMLRICDFSGGDKDREEWLREDGLKAAGGSAPRLAFVTRLIVEELERDEAGQGPLETVVMEKRCKDCGRKAHVMKKGWRKKYWFFGLRPMWPSWETYRRDQERYRVRREMEKKLRIKKKKACPGERKKRKYCDLRNRLMQWAWEWGI